MSDQYFYTGVFILAVLLWGWALSQFWGWL